MRHCVLQCTINYWCRCRHYRHVINTAEEGLKRYANDPFLKFIVAFGMMMEGNDRSVVLLRVLVCYVIPHVVYRHMSLCIVSLTMISPEWLHSDS